MPLILSVSCMEEHFMAAREERNCRIVKKKVEIKACLLLDPQDDFLTW